MIFAERDDIPILIGGAVFLDVRADLGLLDAGLFWAIRGKRLLAELSPVLQPTPAFAGIFAGPVYVCYFHFLFGFCRTLRGDGRRVADCAWKAGTSHPFPLVDCWALPLLRYLEESLSIQRRPVALRNPQEMRSK